MTVSWASSQLLSLRFSYLLRIHLQAFAIEPSPLPLSHEPRNLAPTRMQQFQWFTAEHQNTDKPEGQAEDFLDQDYALPAEVANNYEFEQWIINKPGSQE